MSLQRWQQAFEDHPIPTTRGIEKQLRTSVANNRERLRGIVGGNYRALLSTADKIVHLDAKTKTTEVQISEIGRQCRPPHDILETASSSGDRLLAEIWLTQACLEAITRAIAGHDILRAARLMVIVRLLQKSLQMAKPQPQSLTALKIRTSSLRKRTLARIDSILTSPRSKVKRMVSAACAYCLITSASATEAHTYTQRLRLEKLKDVASASESSPNQAVEVLRYILTTVRSLKMVFGRPLADGLSNLQRRPILADLDLVSSEYIGPPEMLLLISDDIRSFAPYFKRETTTATASLSSSDTWMTEACQVFAQTLKTRASQTSSMTELLALRRGFISLLLPHYFNSRAGDVICQSIATQVVARAVEIGQAQAAVLTKIVDEILSTSGKSSAKLTLWSDTVANMPLTNGGDDFLRQVHMRYHGKDRNLLNVSKSLDAWILSVTEATDAAQDAKLIRWRDLLESTGDDEEEEKADEIVTTLSQSEPQQILHHIQNFIEEALRELQTRLLAAIRTTIEKSEDVELAVFYLRAVRLIVKPLRKAIAKNDTTAALMAAVPDLYEMLASKVVSRVLQAQLPQEQYDGQAIVDNLPSPAAFSLLQTLCDTMQKIGNSDIWSHAAILQIKQSLRAKLFPTSAEQSAWNDFDKAFLIHALSEPLVSSPESATAKAAASYWQRTRLLFGILSD